MLLSLIFDLQLRLPGCRIIIFTGSRDKTFRLLLREGISLDSIELVYTGRWGLCEPETGFFRSQAWVWKNIRWTRRSDIFLIGPGTQFKDVTRRFRPLFFLSWAILALVLGTPNAFIGMGYWKIEGCLCQKELKLIANRSAFISTRDEASAQKLAILGVLGSRIFSLTNLPT